MVWNRRPTGYDHLVRRAPGGSPKAAYALLDVVELFDRLDALLDQLRENADSWFLSGGADAARAILETRSELHAQLRQLEDELSGRDFWG
jgi:hypothetical protein